MPIQNIQINQAGQGGVFPSIIYILTNDTLEEVMVVGYLNSIVHKFGMSLSEADMALVTTKTSPYAYATQIGWLAVSNVGENWSLTPTTSPSDVNSIIGTQYQVLANDTYAIPQAGDVTLTLSGQNSASLVSNSSGATSWATMTNGQLIIGDTGGTPTAATLTAGTNISITNGAGAITIAASGMAGFSWTVVTGTTENMVSNNGYITNNGSLVTLNLPATSSVGDEIDVIGKGAGGWLIQCGAGQTIVLGEDTTSSGGSLASTNKNDALYIVCTTANTEWHVGSGPQGNITVS